MEKNEIILVIAEFSEYPGPRYVNQGESSGEEFYHKKLNTAFERAYKEKKTLTINLDGTAGYASSFLDEAFGNLIYDFTLEVVQPKLRLVSNEEPDWITMITQDVFNDWEERRKKNDAPKKTISHESWVRLINNELNKKKWI